MARVSFFFGQTLYMKFVNTLFMKVPDPSFKRFTLTLVYVFLPDMYNKMRRRGYIYIYAARVAFDLQNSN